jgi:hypothetical protein
VAAVGAVTIQPKGNFKKTNTWLQKIKGIVKQSTLDKYGRAGVQALSAATPVDSGVTASSWYYEIERTSNSATIIFKNSNINEGVPIALILQYGHGTGTGGYVQGRDYINPAIRPIFDQMSQDAWKEVTSA